MPGMVSIVSEFIALNHTVKFLAYCLFEVQTLRAFTCLGKTCNGLARLVEQHLLREDRLRWKVWRTGGEP
jgi:hypothetical protein